MKLLIVLAMVGASYAGALHRNYLPALGSSQSSFGSSQSSSGSSQSTFGGSQSISGIQSSRPQAIADKNAAILRFDSVITADGFHYSYETSNGIRAGESAGGGGGAGGGGSRGSFAYVGDDGLAYSVAYEAGEGGFRARGAHLPTAPPTPDAILEALEENARDEAAGIFDDGKYRAEQHGGSSGGRGGGGGGHQHSFSERTGYRY